MSAHVLFFSQLFIPVVSIVIVKITDVLLLFSFRCSTLNCEVVVELLSRKLQDHTKNIQMVMFPILLHLGSVYFFQINILNCCSLTYLKNLHNISISFLQRALCALACLMSSDFLSLDHIFNITHKRLEQLSEGTTGPVANKATKVSSGKPRVNEWKQVIQ